MALTAELVSFSWIWVCRAWVGRVALTEGFHAPEEHTSRGASPVPSMPC